MRPLETDVLIIGAGSTGVTIARELARYKPAVAVIDKEVDVGCGETKGSHGFIYSAAGFSWAPSLILKSKILAPGEKLYHPEALKTKLTIDGFNMFKPLTDELDIPFELVRRLMVANKPEELEYLKVVEGLCHEMELDTVKLDREAIFAMEPNISHRTIAGLMGAGEKTLGLVYPWDYVIAMAENAKQNGVRIMLGTELKGIKPLDGGFTVDTTQGQIRTEFIVNAAGGHADKVAQMAGVCDFGLTFQKSQMMLLDKRLHGIINNVIAAPPVPGLSRVIATRQSGNPYLICTPYTDANDPDDTATTRNWTEESIYHAQQMVPDIKSEDVIASFVGVRVFNTRYSDDHILEASAENRKFINAVVRLPGMTPMPAIAKHIVQVLADQGLDLVEKADFDHCRKAMPKPSELEDDERNRLIATDQRYGHIICRCEEVTEGEIVEAIRRGARTVQGIKFRTRAGMGRCQSGFCGPRVVEILARELDIPRTEVTEKGGLSRILLYRSKELLGVGG